MIPSWRDSDTALVLSAFLLPFFFGVLAVASYDKVSIGTFSIIEIDWMVWALIGLCVSLYKDYLLIGDQLALIELKRSPQEHLTGLWTLANALAITFAFGMWALTGYTAGQIPNSPFLVLNDLPPSVINGGAYIMVEGIFLGVMTFGLICRRRLAE